MTHASRKQLLRLVMLADLGICASGLMVSFVPAWHLPLWSSEAALLHRPAVPFTGLAALALSWHLSLRWLGAYKSHRMAGIVSEVFTLFKASLLCALAVLLSLLTSSSAHTHGGSPLGTTLRFAAVTSALLVSSRILGRTVTRELRGRGRNLRNVLIVGTNRRAVELARSLRETQGLGYRVVGFVDSYWHHADAPEEYKEQLLSDFDGFSEILRTQPLDEVMIALPLASCYELTRQIVEECAIHGLLVRYEGNMFDLGRSSRFSPATMPVITLYDRSWGEWGSRAKRLIDIAVAAAALVALSPLFAAIVVLIRLTSPGPIFFVQERLGAGKKRFRMMKFRTMVVNAEKLLAGLEHLNQSQGPTFKLKHDPRVTGLGRFLRSTSLDELPQLLNVLRGDMSLVGPRPLPLRDYAGFAQDVHRRRFSVKPGLTCLWQVKGRSSIGFDEWMELDLNYIDDWSLWLDMKILVQTVPAVLRGSGAM